jgi:hypothetical protein
MSRGGNIDPQMSITAAANASAFDPKVELVQAVADGEPWVRERDGHGVRRGLSCAARSSSMLQLGCDQSCAPIANKARSGAVSGIKVMYARALLCAARQSLSRW